MTKIIVIDSQEYPAYDWTEGQPYPAGEATVVRQAKKAEMQKIGMVFLEPGEASFKTDVTFDAGTEFSVKEDDRKFNVVAVVNKHHHAIPL